MCVGVIIAFVAASAFGAAENSKALAPAQVTFTVIKFRLATVANKKTQYTDATVALAAHPLVAITGAATDATFHLRGAVDLEIRVESADAQETYTPLGIVFQQRAVSNSVRSDPLGRNNFSPAYLNGSSLLVHAHHVGIGPAYHYEFFVLIQRVSDGAIGIIDPGVVNES